MKRCLTILLMLSLLISLCGCELIPGKNRPESKETTQAQTESTAFETEIFETETEPEVSEISAYVEDAFSDTLNFEGNAFSYHIPKIVCQTEEIEEINKEIYDLFYNEIYTSEVLGTLDEYGMPGLCEINYMWGKCGDYLSLVIYMSPYASSGTDYSVWNIDLREAEQVSDEKIVEIFDYDMDSFYLHATDVMGSYCFDTTYQFVPEEMMDEFRQVLMNTISENNVHEAMPYIGEDGLLWMIAGIGSLAGADYYAQAIPFESYPVSQEYLDYIS